MDTNSHKYDFSVIGTRVPRKDAIDKATGAAQYTDDLKLPGMEINKQLFGVAAVALGIQGSNLLSAMEKNFHNMKNTNHWISGKWSKSTLRPMAR